MAAADQQDGVDALIDQWRAERPDLAQDLWAMGIIGRLGRLYLLASRQIEAVLATAGLNLGEFDVLAALRRSGEPFVLRPVDLARGLMLSPAAMTSRLDRLEAAGWVRRQADKEDRRSIGVALTAAGREVVDRAVSIHLANEVALLAPLSGAECATLDGLLRRLLAGLGAPRPSV